LPHPVLLVPSWQKPSASQQPFGQLFASHWHLPLTHSCPAAHETQAAPFAPHAELVGAVTHEFPLQHPVAQSAGRQFATQA
jgi:hypothetical protein